MKQYANPARILHWSIAGLIVGQYILAKLAEDAEHHDQLLQQLALLAHHKSVGITILLLAIIRVVYRAMTPVPELPESMSTWQIRASKWSHTLLYGFLFAMPLSGWLMSSAKAYSVSWFNWVALPDLVGPNEVLASQLHTLHHYLAEALFVLAALHVLAALKHHFMDKDSVLERMAGRGSWALFVITVLLIVVVFGRNSGSESTTPIAANIEEQGVQQLENTQQKSDAEKKRFSQSDLPVWEIDYDQSYIKFTGDQAGAPFEGEWKQWTADIQFDPEQLEKGRFNVSIDVSSGDSDDKERDDTIRSSDFFNVSAFPQAQYQADSFSEENGAYRANGVLTMKSVSAEAPLVFTIDPQGDYLVLSGRSSLDRFVWSIGTGEWADPTWVGQIVDVEVRVVRKQ